MSARDRGWGGGWFVCAGDAGWGEGGSGRALGLALKGQGGPGASGVYRNRNPVAYIGVLAVIVFNDEWIAKSVGKSQLQRVVPVISAQHRNINLVVGNKIMLPAGGVGKPIYRVQIIKINRRRNPVGNALGVAIADQRSPPRRCFP